MCHWGSVRLLALSQALGDMELGFLGTNQVERLRCGINGDGVPRKFVVHSALQRLITYVGSMGTEMGTLPAAGRDI